jgi:hypothetical protein
MNKAEESSNDDPTQIYTNALNDKEQKALSIAKESLHSSFNLEKSIGYLKWEKQNAEKNVDVK